LDAYFALVYRCNLNSGYYLAPSDSTDPVEKEQGTHRGESFVSDYIKQLHTSEPEFEQTHLAPIIPSCKSILRIYPILGNDNLRKVDR
jgi:hypothetical protein